jgi:hypothetical protein
MGFFVLGINVESAVSRLRGRPLCLLKHPLDGFVERFQLAVK